VILPLVGEAAFGTLSAWGKIAHNFLAWPFMAALVLILSCGSRTTSRTGWTIAVDGAGRRSPEEGRPSAGQEVQRGQKLIFWSVVIGGAALSYTGFMLLFPARPAPRPTGSSTRPSTP
jgi:formate dehydrogenase subunit gamma